MPPTDASRLQEPPCRGRKSSVAQRSTNTAKPASAGKRLLLSSYVFHPSPGGISTASALLAGEFARAGHEVRVITRTPNAVEGIGYKVIRDPSFFELVRQILWCDALLSVHVSVRLAWPLLFIPRPWIVAHHGWLAQADGRLKLVDHAKRWLVRSASCISVSRAVADDVAAPSEVIGPPYDDAIFRFDPSVQRDRDLLFVGRLVSSKGADILLEALGQLQVPGYEPRVTIVGDGPEMPHLRTQATRLGLIDRVEFTGAKSGVELSRIFNAHRILVVPSVAPETFGIVALEGIACGCVVVASSEAGGLHEAVGDCGFTFETGNPSALAACLTGLLSEPGGARICEKKAERHLSAFSARNIAEAYLRVINRAFGVVAVASQSLEFSICLGVATCVELTT